MHRLQPAWLNDNDDLILELLGESGVALNKRGIDVNLRLRETPVSYSTIKRRVDKLEENGFVEDVGDDGSYFRLSERGVDYLSGNPYGIASATDDQAVDPISVEPADYEIVQTVAESKHEPSEEEILAQITADRSRAEDRLRVLTRHGVLETNDDRLQLTIIGHVILSSFNQGKPVKTDMAPQYSQNDRSRSEQPS